MISEGRQIRKMRYRITLSISLQIIGWFIYWLFLTIINLKYFNSDKFTKPILILWAILFTLCGISIFYLLTKIYRYLIKKKTKTIKVVALIIISSFLGAYIWGPFEPIISWVIDPKITHLNITWDINTRGTFPLTFIMAFFSILYYFSKILEQSNVQENVLSVNAGEKADLNDTIAVNLKNDIVLLPLKNIKKISIDGNYSRIVDNNNVKYELKKSLKNWEGHLPKEVFLRIHRSTIINKGYIEKIEPWHNQTYRIRLTHIEEPENVSRRYAAFLKKEMNLKL